MSLRLPRASAWNGPPRGSALQTRIHGLLPALRTGPRYPLGLTTYWASLRTGKIGGLGDPLVRQRLRQVRHRLLRDHVLLELPQEARQPFPVHAVLGEDHVLD